VYWADWVILIIVVLSAWKGYRTGLLSSMAGLFAWVAGLFAASRYYYRLSVYLDDRWNLGEKVARFIGQHLPLWTAPLTGNTAAGPGGPHLAAGGALAQGVVQVAAFLAILLGVEVVIHSLARSVSSLIAVTPLVVVDRLGGLVFGVLWGGVWVLILTMVATRLLSPALLQPSVILPYLRQLTGVFHIPWRLVTL